MVILERRLSMLRALVGLLAVFALMAGSCGSDDSEADAASGPDEETTNQRQVPEGVAAVVDGTEITDRTVEEWFDEAAKSPEVAARLEGGQGEQIRPALRAQILSRLIVSDILTRAASDDFGIEVSDEEVVARRDELVKEAGGEDALAQQLATAGLTEELLVEHELPMLIILEEVEKEFSSDTDPEATTTTTAAVPGAQPPPTESQQAMQEWGRARFAEADVTVRTSYGTWDPQTGQVQPEGGVPSGPAPGSAP